MASPAQTQCKGKIPYPKSRQFIRKQPNQTRTGEQNPLMINVLSMVLAAKTLNSKNLDTYREIYEWECGWEQWDGFADAYVQLPPKHEGACLKRCENWATEELAPALCYFWWRSVVFLQHCNTEVMQNVFALWDYFRTLHLKANHIFLSKYKQK